jgi:hypothetical protein
MSFLAALGGWLLAPTVGTVASRLAADVIKPGDMSNTLLIGAGAHAVSALMFNHFTNTARDPGWKSFSNGGQWAEGITAGLLGAGGIYMKTDSGKAMLAKGLASAQANGVFATSQAPAKPVPGGVLGFLVMAKKAGY